MAKKKELVLTEWQKGFEAACLLLEEWDKYIVHPFRLSDCIWYKANQPTMQKKSKIRFNPHGGKS